MSQEGRPPRRLHTYERWTDRQVREGMAQGRFDELAGAGKPLPDIDEPHDELWWLRKKLREEDVEVLPPSLVLRREVEQLLSRAQAAPTEYQAEKLIEQANAKIRRANRLGVAGPAHNLSPYDPVTLLERWREVREAAASALSVPGPVSEATPAPPDRRRGWWRRRR